MLVDARGGYRLFVLEERDADVGATEIVGSYGSFHVGPVVAGSHHAVFFYATHGERDLAGTRRRAYRAAGRPGDRIILDPRRMVESLADTERGQATAASELGLGEPWDWFVEMVAGWFPGRFYALHLPVGSVRPDDGALAAVRDWANAETRAQLDEKDPSKPWFVPITAARRKEVEALLDNPEYLTLPQGFRSSPRTRFIGADRGWCYERDLETGAVYVRPTNQYIWDIHVGGVSQLVYENTRGTIPLLAVTFAAAAAAPVVAIAGPAAVASWLSKEAVSSALHRGLKELAKKLLPALAAQMTKVVATLFGEDEWRAFAEGFFEGYLLNTIYNNFYENMVLGFVTNGPKEYRMYMTAKRMFMAIEKVHEVVQTLEEELDEDTLDTGVRLFRTAVESVGQGVLLLLGALGWADYDDVQPLLEAFTRDVDPEYPDPPSREEFEVEMGAQVGGIAGKIHEQLDLSDVTGLVAALKDSTALKLGATLVILEPYLSHAVTSTWRNRPQKWKKWEVKYVRPARPAIYLVAAAGLVGLLMYANDETDGAVWDTTTQLLSDLVTNLPGPTPERAKVHGEIVGSLLGAFAFNSMIFKDPSYATRKGKWKDASAGKKWQKFHDIPLLGTFFKNNLKIGVFGPIIKVVFMRYISLYEELRAGGLLREATSEETIGRFLSEIDDAMLKQRGLEHLKDFRTEEESTAVSLERLIVVIVKLRTMLGRDLAEYLGTVSAGKVGSELDKRFGEDVRDFAALANAIGVSDVNLDGLMKQHPETAFRTMAVHLYGALTSLEDGLKALMTPFTESEWSWIELLRQLGLDVGDVAGAQAEYRKLTEERLAPFRTAQETT